jgi:outer membrane receptor protein involved in Fe transport
VQCARTGVTAAQYGNGGTTNTIPQGTAGQLTQLQGGNPLLKPERGDTYTIGVTFQPEFLPDFTGSLDYYHIDIKDEVGALPADVILNNCLTQGDPIYCSQIVRQPLNGTLNGASVAGGGYIIQTSVNIGENVLSGVDLQAQYRFDLGALGKLRLMMNGAYLINSESTPIPGGGTYDCAGLFGKTCQTVNPTWRHNLRAAWDLPSDVTLSATWRYMDSVKLDNNDSNPLLNGASLGAPAILDAKIAAISYFDLAATWQYTEHLQLRAGINNLLDKDPPIVPSDIISGGAPNYYEFYDGLGRQVFAAFTMKF